MVGLTGVWMTLFYQRADGTGDLLYAFRLVFGSAMVVSIVLGLTAILPQERQPPPRLDDARLRDRTRRGHADADPDGWGSWPSARRMSSATTS